MIKRRCPVVMRVVDNARVISSPPIHPACERGCGGVGWKVLLLSGRTRGLSGWPWFLHPAVPQLALACCRRLLLRACSRA